MLEQYVNYIKNNPFSLNQRALGDELFIEQTGELSVYYAPFEYINKDAKIIICGITPGIKQAILALEEASKQLTRGSSIEATKKAAKNTASFGGPIRKNLIRLLDYIGLPPKLGITSCSDYLIQNLISFTTPQRYAIPCLNPVKTTAEHRQWFPTFFYANSLNNTYYLNSGNLAQQRS
jgi:hypothetical protein